MDAATNPKNPIATKLTAAQITENCPAKLTDLGKRITAHLAKAGQCDEKANNHRISAAQCLLQAKEACDEGGFNAFRERCCPELGRTRAYELLSIATGKKTVTEIRAATAGRMQKHRAEKAATLSVTVTDAVIDRPTIVEVAHRTAPDETVSVRVIEPTPAITAIDIDDLRKAWSAVPLQAAAGNETLLKAALGNLISEASIILKTLNGLQ